VLEGIEEGIETDDTIVRCGSYSMNESGKSRLASAGSANGRATPLGPRYACSLRSQATRPAGSPFGKLRERDGLLGDGGVSRLLDQVHMQRKESKRVRDHQ
jgi:hypothetical protein